MTDLLWQPSKDRVQTANLQSFTQRISASLDSGVLSSDELYKFSISEPEAFWSNIWDHCGIIGEKGQEPYLVNPDQMPGAQFFPGARLNYAENLLRRNDTSPALVFWGEDKVKQTMSWSDLNRQAAQFQDLLSAQGLTSGDRVAAIMPNIPQTVAAMLGATASGVVWSSCSPDFGVRGVLDRFSQIEPKVLIACDGYYYGGKTFSIVEKLEQIVAELPTLERVIIVHYAGNCTEAVAAIDHAVAWDEAVLTRDAEQPVFEPLPFSHPLYIMFSSGTTGAPKCIVHSTGGTLLQHVKEHILHCDIKPGERVFYFTTCGWMMWNWLVSALAAQATLLLYDGSPFYPDGNILFDFADAEDMTIFGTSAKYIDALKKAELRPRDSHALTSLKMMASTGSPLAPESFDFVYDAIKPDIHLASVSGGTDIISCFVIGHPQRPVYRGEIQGPGLGMAVDIVDHNGQHLAQGKGELICRTPFPSMPIKFWNDPGDEKYHAAYFSRFENIWQQGDFAEWTKHGGIIIHGRSDATLNPGGVRIGTAEIYRQVEQFEEINESIVIGQHWQDDVRIILFVVLRDGYDLDDDLIARIKKQIRSGASPRHVPAKILTVPDIPRTKSGKITELAVRDIVHGREINNTEALANPSALEFYRNIAELQE